MKNYEFESLNLIYNLIYISISYFLLKSFEPSWPLNIKYAVALVYC